MTSELRSSLDRTESLLGELEYNLHETAGRIHELQNMLNRVRFLMKSREGVRGKMVDEYCEMIECIEKELGKIWEEL